MPADGAEASSSRERFIGAVRGSLVTDMSTTHRSRTRPQTSALTYVVQLYLMQLFSLPHRLSLVEIHLGTSAAGCRQPPPTRGESAEGQHCSERRNTQYPRERPTPVAARSRRTAAPGASAALGAAERREAGSELMGEPAHGVCSSPKRMQLSCGGVKFFAGGQCEHPLLQLLQLCMRRLQAKQRRPTTPAGVRAHPGRRSCPG